MIEVLYSYSKYLTVAPAWAGRFLWKVLHAISFRRNAVTIPIGAQRERMSPNDQLYRWPPRILMNFDGCQAFKYLRRRHPEDVTELMIPLADTGVDVICALVGVDDDLSWRGSPYGELWGDTLGYSIDDLLTESGEPRSKAALNLEPNDLLQMALRAMVDDGHDVYQLYVDRARELSLGIFA